MLDILRKVDSLMFIWQKLKYSMVFMKYDTEFYEMKKVFNSEKPEIVSWDTETDGLHLITSIPFLLGFAFNKKIYIYEPTKWRNEFLFELVMIFVKYFVAHNAKYDYHMMINFGTPIPESVPLG